MRILLDTNIVLDVLLDRMPWQGAAEAVMQTSRAGQFRCAISSLTVANVFYIGRRQVGVAKARDIVRACLAAFEILPIDRRTLEDADRLTGSDFEDNVQIASATIADVDAIVTRDPGGFTGNLIDVMSPQQFIESLKPSSGAQ
jgi:predicted nucleic acid-binding protein